MITKKVSSTPRNAYLRCNGKGFNSSLGGFSSEGNTLSSIVAIFQIWVPTHFLPLPHYAQLWSAETPIQMWLPPRHNLGLLDKT